MSDVKLKPCPFCGCEAEGDQCRGFVNYKGQSASAVAVYCTGCEAEFSMCYDDFPEYLPEHLMAMVVERWNKRTPLDAHKKALVEAKSALEWFGGKSVVGPNYHSALATINSLLGQGVEK